MNIPAFNLSRSNKIILACTMVLIWIFIRQQISEMDGIFFQPSTHGAKGLALYLIGDYSGAAKAYRAHFQEEFQTGRTTGNPGLNALLRGELGAAKELSRKALEKDPENIEALLNLGEAALEENDLKHALEISERILKKEPDHADASILASLAFARLGDDGKAVDALNRTLRHSRIGSRPISFLMFLETTGDKALLPEKEKPLCLLANYYRYLRIYDESNGRPAIAYAEKAIAAGDRPADAYLAIGIVHEKQDRPEEAIAAFIKAIEVDPKHADAYRSAARVYELRGDDLLNEYRMRKAAYESVPDDPFHTIWYIPFLYGKLGDFHQALYVSLAALKRWPENTELLRHTGEIYKWLGEYEASIMYHRKILAIQPKNVAMHNSIAYSLNELGKMEEAIAEYKTTLAINPNEVGAHHGLAWTYHDHHRYGEAITEYETAIRLGVQDVNVRAALCSLYHFELEFRRAANCFKVVVAQDPNNKIAMNLLPYTLRNLEQGAR